MPTNTLNPILLHLGPLTIRWYGLFLAVGVGLAIYIIAKLFKQKKYPVNLAYDFCTWLIVGGLIGARLGEILFYEPAFYFSHPLEMIMINHGGLSSHGMTLGLLITLVIFSKIKKISIKQYLDILIIPIPLLAMFIRIGNFFNSEIVGRTTNLPWGVYFPNYEQNPVLRHPTQLYEALILLMVYGLLSIVYRQYRAKLPPLFITNLFLILYFSSRFLIEYLKEFSTYFGLTTGQWLSVPFVVWGVIYFVKLKNKC